MSISPAVIAFANDRRGAELDTISGLDTIRIENGQNDVAKDAALSVDLGRHDHLCLREAGKLNCACKEGQVRWHFP